MRKQFFDLYEILRTTRCSLVVLNKKTNQKMFISHNAFNALDRATDIRETEIERNGQKYLWLEVALWQR
jgi:hypothetical protein